MSNPSKLEESWIILVVLRGDLQPLDAAAALQVIADAQSWKLVNYLGKGFLLLTDEKKSLITPREVRTTVENVTEQLAKKFCPNDQLEPLLQNNSMSQEGAIVVATRGGLQWVPVGDARVYAGPALDRAEDLASKAPGGWAAIFEGAGKDKTWVPVQALPHAHDLPLVTRWHSPYLVDRVSLDASLRVIRAQLRADWAGQGPEASRLRDPTNEVTGISTPGDLHELDSDLGHAISSLRLLQDCMMALREAGPGQCLAPVPDACGVPGHAFSKVWRQLASAQALNAPRKIKGDWIVGIHTEFNVAVGKILNQLADASARVRSQR